MQPDGTFWIRAAPGKSYVYLRADRRFRVVGPVGLDVVVEDGRTLEVRFVVRPGASAADGDGEGD